MASLLDEFSEVWYRWKWTSNKHKNKSSWDGDLQVAFFPTSKSLNRNHATVGLENKSIYSKDTMGWRWGIGDEEVEEEQRRERWL